MPFAERTGARVVIVLGTLWATLGVLVFAHLPVALAVGVAALAGAADASRWAGTIASARQLADAYGVTWPSPWRACAAPHRAGWPSGGTTAGWSPASLTTRIW